MKNFSAEYSAEAFSQLKDLDKAVAKRIMRKIESALDDPHQFFKRLSGRPEYTLRAGDYRVIADIEEARKIIFIRSIGHRKNVYEKV